MAAVNMLVGNTGAMAPMSSYPQTPSVASGSETGVTKSAKVVDGTPLRVATLAVLAIGGLAGLRWAGFKFNVTVG